MALYVKNSGGLLTDEVQKSIYDYLDKYMKGWDDFTKTVAFPVIPDPKFSGPLGLASGSIDRIPDQKGTTDFYWGLKKGHDAETSVLRALEEICRESHDGFRLFHDLPIKQDRLDAIRRSFSPNSEHEKSGEPLLDGEMCDILVISKYAIGLVEVAATLRGAESKLDQKKKPGDKQPLVKGLAFIKKVINAVGIDSESIPIHCFLAVPNCNRTEIDKKLPKRDQYHYLAKEDLKPDNSEGFESDESSLFLNTLKTGEVVLKDDALKNLTAACVTLLVSFIKEADANAILEISSEGVKGDTIARLIIRQEHLKPTFDKQSAISAKSGKAIDAKQRIQSVEKDSNYRFITNQILFFTPEQALILNSVPNPKQIIFGPAATGKTLLIQAKATNLIKTGSPVLVLIPKPLHILYNKFFDSVLNSADKQLLKMCSFESEEDLESLKHYVKEKNCSLLIDEYSAIISALRSDAPKELLNNFHEILRNLPVERICWITVDPLQTLFEKSFSPTIKIPGLENATISYLLTVHRCTNNVFCQWKKNCGEFVTIGHQYDGLPSPKIEKIIEESSPMFAIKIAANIESYLIQQRDLGWSNKDLMIFIDDAGWVGSDRYLLLEELREKLPIDEWGEETAEDSIGIAFLSQHKNCHSFEWNSVLCIREESDDENFNDYFVRSRAIFKLSVMPCVRKHMPETVAERKLDRKQLEKRKRQLFIVLYEMMAVEQHLVTCPHLISKEVVLRSLSAPLQQIAEATILYYSCHLFDLFSQVFGDDASASFQKDLKDAHEALKQNYSEPLDFCNIEELTRQIQKRKEALKLMDNLITVGRKEYEQEKDGKSAKSRYKLIEEINAYQIEPIFWHEATSSLYFEQIRPMRQYWIENSRRILPLIPSEYDPNNNLQACMELIENSMDDVSAIPASLQTLENFRDFEEFWFKAIKGLQLRALSHHAYRKFEDICMRIYKKFSSRKADPAL